MVRLESAFPDRAFKKPDGKKGPGRPRADPVRLAKNAVAQPAATAALERNEDGAPRDGGTYTPVASLGDVFQAAPFPVSLAAGAGDRSRDETVLRIRRGDLELGMLVVGVLVLLWIVFSLGGRIARLEARIDRLVEVVAAGSR